ncbi:hypothetical protein ACOMHN_008743 [Nucella lapillus]
MYDKLTEGGASRSSVEQRALHVPILLSSLTLPPYAVKRGAGSWGQVVQCQKQDIMLSSLHAALQAFKLREPATETQPAVTHRLPLAAGSHCSARSALAPPRIMQMRLAKAVTS